MENFFQNQQVVSRLLELGMTEEQDPQQFYEGLDSDIQDDIRRQVNPSQEIINEETAEIEDSSPLGPKQYQPKIKPQQNVEDNEDYQEEMNDWVQNDYQQMDPGMLTADQRFMDVANLKRQTELNVLKMKARVQLLKVTQERNLQKARLLDINSEKIQKNKETKIQRQQMLNQLHRREAEQKYRKHLEIQQQKEKHFQILQQHKGNLGLKHQQRIWQVQRYKSEVRMGYQQTLNSVYSENKKLHDQIKDQELMQLRRSQELWNNKYQIARRNYRQRVEQELNIAMMQQQQLEQLERREQKMLERIKITQQIYQNANQKNQEIRRLDYHDMLKTM